MKRLFYAGLVVVCGCLFAGCPQTGSQEPPSEAEVEAEIDDQMEMLEAEMANDSAKGQATPQE